MNILDTLFQHYTSTANDKNITNSFQNRVQSYLEFFLDTKYGFLDYTGVDEYSPLIEKVESLKSKDEFQYSLNKFDCVTLTETILSLMNIETIFELESFEQQFIANLKAIRYKNSVSSFILLTYLTRSVSISLLV